METTVTHPIHKTVEQRLYEAFRAGRGVRLTADEVDSLVRLDDAILSRMANAAAIEAGVDEPGADIGDCSLTWKEQIEKMKSWK